MTPSRALTELIRSDDVYGVPNNLAVAPFKVEHLKLARRPLVPKDVASLVSPEARDYILDAFKWIVKSDDELLEDADSGKTIQPYWDRGLKQNRGAMIGFLKILAKSGLNITAAETLQEAGERAVAARGEG